MDFDGLFHFFFETMPGVGCLLGISLLVSVAACVLMERRTKKRYANHESSEDDWSFFGDDDDK